MSVKEAIAKAQSKYQESLKKQREKRTHKPATPTGIIQFFNDLYLKNEMGYVPTLKKQDKHKVTGFVKLLKNNGYEDREIYEFIERVFDAWSRLTAIDMHTDNRKKYILDTRPNLIDLIHCKTQIFQELNEKEDDTPQTDDLLELWRSGR